MEGKLDMEQRPQRYNVDLLRATRDKVLMEPKAHDQGSWGKFRSKTALKNASRGQSLVSATHNGQHSIVPYVYYESSCPSTACAAGWAATLAGARMCVDADRVDYALGTKGARIAETVSKCVTPDGQVEPIQDYAQEQLGLNMEESKLLFNASNSRQRVLDLLDIYIKAGDQIR